MIHSLHRHQREEYKICERSPEYIDKQKRRKHFNSRRNFVNYIKIIQFYFNNLSFIYIFITETSNPCKNDNSFKKYRRSAGPKN